MKKVFAGSVLAVMAFSSAGSALAHGVAVEASTKVRATVQAKVEAKKEEKQQDRQERRMNEIKKFWQKMEHRLTILLENQEKLADRIEAKLAKMKADGKDVAALETKLVNARKMIADAREALAKGDAAVMEALKGNDPKVAFEKTKSVVKDVLQKIKAAHRALVDVINSAKGKTPTPTPTVTPTTS